MLSHFLLLPASSTPLCLRHTTHLPWYYFLPPSTAIAPTGLLSCAAQCQRPLLPEFRIHAPEVWWEWLYKLEHKVTHKWFSDLSVEEYSVLLSMLPGCLQTMHHKASSHTKSIWYTVLRGTEAIFPGPGSTAGFSVLITLKGQAMIDLLSFRYLSIRLGMAVEPVHLKMKMQWACCVWNELWQSVLFKLFFQHTIPFSMVSLCSAIRAWFAGREKETFSLYMTIRTTMCTGIVSLDNSVSKISL